MTLPENVTPDAIQHYKLKVKRALAVKALHIETSQQIHIIVDISDPKRHGKHYAKYLNQDLGFCN